MGPRAGEAAHVLQREAVLAAFEQGLADLAVSGASDVLFVHTGRTGPSAFAEAAESRALAMGFAVASFSLTEDAGFQAFDQVVRAALRSVRGPRSSERGLPALLGAFVGRSPKKALERFDEAVRELPAPLGDLGRLARAYLAAASAPRHELRVIRAFVDGGDLSRAGEEDPPAPLDARTARRTLEDFARLVRALGHEGLVLVIRKADLSAHTTRTQREVAYGVLRELVDNTSGLRGLLATRLVAIGGAELFEGATSITCEVPLALRVLPGASADGQLQGAIAPHATFAALDPGDGPAAPGSSRAAAPPPRSRARAVRSIVRLAQGVPPDEVLDELTVGYDAVDAALEKLFAHATNDGSTFSVLVGDYGTGKTHLLVHVAQRARAERRPVFRLDVERIDADLGSPQRHFRRLIEHGALPLPGNPGPLDRLDDWTRSEVGDRRLVKALSALSEEEGEASGAARRVLRAREEGGPRAARGILAGLDLAHKASNPNYRADAYARLLLWIQLLERIDGCAGPVLLIDEAENLYRAGTSRAERRTALRSLAFYCGGSLPRACVVLAVTPDTLAALREESAALLDEVEGQRTLLAWEDPLMLRRRLLRSKPLEVSRLSTEELTLLAGRARELHASVRGAVKDPDFDTHVAELIGRRTTPRALLRGVVQRLEARWWRPG